MNSAHPTIETRTQELFLQSSKDAAKSIGRVFVGLMLLQWTAGIAAAIYISPRTWLGATSSVHPHFWIALLFGGLISLPAIVLALRYPDRKLTRHVVAVSQMLWSVLLIHLTGGRLETHFHVFGSLAFLAFYRDWRVILTATIVVAGDHFIRGVWFPLSVFGAAATSPYRWLEHAGWVVFEDIFLLFACTRGHNELNTLCQRQAQLEGTNAQVENTVRERTKDLETTCLELEHQITQRTRAEKEREHLSKQYVKASRQAGMAEVATGVLHNVGNVLNSVTVSCNVLIDGIAESKVSGLERAVKLLDENSDDLPGFFDSNKGEQLTAYLRQLTERLNTEKNETLEEVEGLRNHVQHITEIVGMQQSYARGGGFNEELDMSEVVENAIQINGASFLRHGVELVLDFEEVPKVVSDKHRILQILINLIGNAKHAASESPREDKQVAVRLKSVQEGTVTVEVADNGIGIAVDNLDKIFNHGFTTKSDGHGFGLHSSANAATEVGGTLSAKSGGPDKGATFILTLPLTFDATKRSDTEDLQLVGEPA